MTEQTHKPLLNQLSPEALSAAVRGGTEGWGTIGSIEHVRYIQAAANKRSWCRCGCGGAASHMGMANGVSLDWGCELAMRRWVKDPFSFGRSIRAVIRKEGIGPKTAADCAYLAWKKGRTNVST